MMVLLIMTLSVLTKMMLQFMNNNNGDLGGYGTQFIMKVSLRSVEIIAMFSISILNYHLFVVTGTKSWSVRHSKNLHSTPWMSYWIQSHPNILEQSVLVI